MCEPLADESGNNERISCVVVYYAFEFVKWSKIENTHGEGKTRTSL